MTDKVTPKIDLGFKKIFGVEENKDLLISLVNSIVSEEDQIDSLEITNPYNIQHFKDDKLSVLDIKAKALDGRRFNIEIQIRDATHYPKRILYYWGRMYTEQLQKGEDYAQLSKAIGIHIVNFDAVPENDDYHSMFRIKEVKKDFEYFDDMELHIIELKKFSSGIENDHDKLISKIKTSLDAWVAFLTKYELLDPSKDPIGAEITKAIDVIEHMNLTAEERESYEARLKWLRDEVDAIETAERKAAEVAKVEGREEGKIEMAKAMLADGESAERIAKYSGLSVDEINSLKV